MADMGKLAFNLLRRIAPALIASWCLMQAPLALSAEDPDYFSISMGYYDANRRTVPAAEGRLEYRSDHRMWIFKPFAGVMGTNRGTADAFAGVYIDVYLGNRWVVSPSFAPSVYHKGGGKDLGYGLEFRSQIELAYRFDDRSRLGFSLNHLSNAGLGRVNPGTESIVMTYSIPASKIFNWR